MNVKTLDFLGQIINQKKSASILCYSNQEIESIQSIFEVVLSHKKAGDQIFEFNTNLENKLNIKILRELKQKLTLKTPENKQFCVIKNIEEVSIPCLNAFLKILEEPSDNVFFILITSNVSKVLETIKSRSYLLFINQDFPKASYRENLIYQAITDPKQSYFHQEKELEIDKKNVLETIWALETDLKHNLDYGNISFDAYSKNIRFLNQQKNYIDANVGLKSILLSLVLQFSNNQVKI